MKCKFCKKEVVEGTWNNMWHSLWFFTWFVLILWLMTRFEKYYVHKNTWTSCGSIALTKKGVIK
jgi:hypothetical protein